MPNRSPALPSVTGSLLAALAAGLALLASAPAAAQPDADVSGERVAGTDRYATAANLSAATFDTAEVAHVVTGEDFPDALAGSYAAGAVGGPLLLVTADSVPPSTRDELDRLDAHTVVIVGGDAAVGEEVADELADAGYAVDRLSGADRYATAAAVASHYGQLDPAGTVDGQPAALLTSGQDFPDALAAGPLAVRAHLPLLLTPADRTDDHVDATLAQLGIERLVVVGGSAAVDDSVTQHYQAHGVAVERWAGADRTATAATVADNARAELGFTPDVVVLARGDDYPDALTASVHAGRQGAPLLLARSATTLSEPTETWLGAACPDVGVVRAVGGDAAVSPAMLGEAVAAAAHCPVEEVASFTTALQPGQSRNVNIHRAADYVDGSVIPPGATFSLNEAIGPRTRERGFVENGFIDPGGEVISVVGGGVSQVATTFVNAAWFAGIHLADFRQHTIYFERYPMCREATLAWGSIDTVVVNDSPYEITVSASYTDSSVTFALHSRPWAQVDSWIGQPYAVDGGAFSVDCGRTITYPDGTQTSEDYTWRYDSGFPG